MTLADHFDRDTASVFSQYSFMARGLDSAPYTIYYLGMTLTLTRADGPRDASQRAVWAALFQAAAETRRQSDQPIPVMAAWLARFGYGYDVEIGAVPLPPKAAPKAAPVPPKAAPVPPKTAPVPPKTAPVPPKTAPVPPKTAPETDPVAEARARYGTLFPEAFHKRSGALNKGWLLIRGCPTWAAALEDRAR